MNINKLSPVFQSVINEVKPENKKKLSSKTQKSNENESFRADETKLFSVLEEYPAPEVPNLEEVRQKILNNEYQVDYERLAESLLKLESYIL